MSYNDKKLGCLNSNYSAMLCVAIIIAVFFILNIPAAAIISVNNRSCQNDVIIDYIACSLSKNLFDFTKYNNKNVPFIEKSINHRMIHGHSLKSKCNDTVFSNLRHISKNLNERSYSLVMPPQPYINYINGQNQKLSICLRSGPGFEYNVIKKYKYLPKTLIALKKNNGWFLVCDTINGVMGWIGDFNVKGIEKNTALSIKSCSRKKHFSGSTIPFTIKTDVANQQRRNTARLTESNQFQMDYRSAATIKNIRNKSKTINAPHQSNPIGSANRSSLPSLAIYSPSNNQSNLSIGSQNGLLPYFIVHLTDGLIPNIRYKVIEDKLIFAYTGFHKKSEIADTKESKSGILLRDKDHFSYNIYNLFTLDSGTANFDKFIITDDGHIHVSAGISDQFEHVLDEGVNKLTTNPSIDVNQSWAFMPLIFVSRSNIEKNGIADFYRIRNIQKLGAYSSCTHTVTDGSKDKVYSTSSQYIIGNAEICFDASGKKAMIIYGYELWVPISPDNIDACLSIDLERRQCRVSDSRLTPMISYWTSYD